MDDQCTLTGATTQKYPETCIWMSFRPKTDFLTLPWLTRVPESLYNSLSCWFPSMTAQTDDAGVNACATFRALFPACQRSIPSRQYPLTVALHLGRFRWTARRGHISSHGTSSWQPPVPVVTHGPISEKIDSYTPP